MRGCCRAGITRGSNMIVKGDLGSAGKESGGFMKADDDAKVTVLRAVIMFLHQSPSLCLVKSRSNSSPVCICQRPHRSLYSFIEARFHDSDESVVKRAMKYGRY